MYHDYIRTRKPWKRVLIALGIFLFFVALFHGGSEAFSKETTTEVESAPIINEQTTETNISAQQNPELPEPKVSVLPTPLPSISASESAPITSEPLPSTDGIQTECPEIVEPAEEPAPVRENKLYYFMEDGIRTDIPIEYQDYLYGILKEYNNQDKYELMLALIYHESGWDPSVVSKTKDYGLTQINKCNHAWLRESLGITDFLDPYQSMDAGVHILCSFFDKYDDAEYALLCYNMGEGGAKRSGRTSSTYTRGVFADMELLVELEC